MTMNRGPPPPPPPPLPPPPPPHEPPNDVPNNDGNDSDTYNTTATNNSNSAIAITTISVRSAVVPDDIINLLITPQMTQNEFAHCISHAALSPPHSQHLLQSWSLSSSLKSSSSPLPLSFLRRNYNRGGARGYLSRNSNYDEISYSRHNDNENNHDYNEHEEDEYDDDEGFGRGGNILSTAATTAVAAADWTHIAGLFRESDNAFVPISILLHNPQAYQNDLFRISRSTLLLPPNNNKRKRKMKLVPDSPSLFSWRGLSSFLLSLFGSKYFVQSLILGALCAIVYQISLLNYIDWDTSVAKFFHYSEYMVQTMKRIPSQVDEYCINVPLQNLYRYGPNVLGWEGESLPRICQQITHMADEQFWLRNIEECTKIYNNKESAMLHVRKPLVYIVLMYTFFLMVQSLIRTWATVRQSNSRSMYRRDMVETYEAFDLIMKVICRGMMKYAPPPPPPPPQHMNIGR